MIFHIRQKLLSSQSGLSIVATVMIMLILALFAAAAVSLITTSTGSGIQEERGVESFYIAEGGFQYTLKKNTYPYYDGDYEGTTQDDIITNKALGDGSFTVTVPTLDSSVTQAETATIDVSSTEGFVQTSSIDTNYVVVLCDTSSATKPTVRMTSDCEKISAAGKTSGAFGATAGDLTRGADSTVTASFDHLAGAVVMMYTYDTNHTASLSRNFATGSKCNNAPSRICVSDTTPFADSGFIRMHYGTNNDNNEDIFYYGKCDPNAGCNVSTVCGSTCTGTGTTGCLGYDSSAPTASVCTRRAYDYASGNGTTPHSAGATIYKSEFSVIVTSEGKTLGAIILTDIKRVLQINVLPLRDP